MSVDLRRERASTLTDFAQSRKKVAEYMEQTDFEKDILTQYGATRVTFRNDPKLSVTIDRVEPFFREVEKCWNQTALGRRDPHAPIRNLADWEGQLTLEEQREFLKAFFLVAATAVRHLEQGHHSENASLEHHAQQM